MQLDPMVLADNLLDTSRATRGLLELKKETPYRQCSRARGHAGVVCAQLARAESQLEKPIVWLVRDSKDV